MPWPFALPQALFASPILSTAMPLATGYLVDRERELQRKNFDLQEKTH